MRIDFTGLQHQAARLRGEIDRRVGRVLDSGQFILGPEVTELEKRLTEFSGAGETVTVANGTDALQIALMALGVGPGDTVFIPSFTFTATAEVVLLLGSRPVFVDIDARSFNLDCADLERRIAEERRKGGRPKAIIGVDLFGLPADWPRLSQIAKREDVFLLSDAAQSFGGAIAGQRVGTLAPITATSFFPAKPLGCYGDGGALFVGDPELATIIRSIRGHGQGATKYETTRVGVNSRLDTIQAAVLLVKLGVLDEEIARRDAVAHQYSRQLGGLVETPTVPEGVVSAWAQYTIRVAKRVQLQSALAEAGVPTAVYYPKPMHLQPAYSAYGQGLGSLPVSEAAAEQVLSLPMNAYASAEEINHVCEAIARAVGRLGM